jgi:GTP-sensing pleiotropic transcriptional regulator CodY
MQFENGTDVHFMNEYTQVVSQNLDVIMKNSFILQAKYNVLEKALNQRIGNDGQVSEQISELQRQISSLAEEKNH